MLQVVLDTNVLVAGLRSKRGASAEVLRRVGADRFSINVTVPLLIEYESVLMRTVVGEFVSENAVAAVLDYHAEVGRSFDVYFLWRPTLPDPGDDMVLEAAVAANASLIVTHNLRDFRGVERFGISAITPADLLRRIDTAP